MFYTSNSTSNQWQRLLLLGSVALYSAYEVWAFTHGRSTTIDNWTHEGNPANTSMRVYGLALDLLFFVGAAYLIVFSGDA